MACKGPSRSRLGQSTGHGSCSRYQARRLIRTSWPTSFQSLCGLLWPVQLVVAAISALFIVEARTRHSALP